jgi:hypothetical protein
MHIYGALSTGCLFRIQTLNPLQCCSSCPVLDSVNALVLHSHGYSLPRHVELLDAILVQYGPVSAVVDHEKGRPMWTIKFHDEF